LPPGARAVVGPGSRKRRGREDLPLAEELTERDFVRLQERAEREMARNKRRFDGE
jgi:hypothetical protein